MGPAPISDREFVQFQRFIFDAAGITLSPAKKALVSGRLAKRLQQYRLDNYGEYFRLLASGEAPEETQTAIDLLTTNETYFFREPKHFDFLRQHVAATHRRTETFRVWSAASSSGEEAYSIAMTLADCLGDAPWEVVGSDISMRVLQRARAGHYPLERCKHIPPAYLRRFCLRGIGAQQGTLLIDGSLRNRVRFTPANLNAALPQLGSFDAIFLRNVMIYFNNDTKRKVVERVLPLLKRGGHFYIGHAESLNDITKAVHMLAPSVYRKP
ncbi:MAG: protein-glutamate O-methyltransferase CheR [Mizugakiibacter sp.]|uniref:CheR family methyltransferase n=1 Tax=Mizugakiibacter sp. TaxID=1972610 RepID=UPI0031BE44D7|nr:protein-glutamate O-methyltransferase CheR [Xanthomonadaceae bacterium]